MEKGTNTYAALDHVCDLIEKNSNSELTALFVITDGEPRDDDNRRMVQRRGRQFGIPGRPYQSKITDI